MENRAKLSFPRTLFSPFASCKAHKLIADVIHPHCRRRQRHPQEEQIIPHSSTSMEPLLPPSVDGRRPNYPSMCKPRCRETLHEMVRESCILAVDIHKLSGNRTPRHDAVRGGGWIRCPPASPSTPPPQKQGKKKNRVDELSSSGEDWFSSDDERETESESEHVGTLFSSSQSFLSLNSSEPDSMAPNLTRVRRRPPSARRREARKRKAALEEKVKGSFAVVKSSNDPYTDFRASMVEMIMEKKIFGARELEQLLECFLSLNSPHHHRVIVQVFAEICDALFFNRLGF